MEEKCHSIIQLLNLHSIDATQTALADKGVFASERTLYRWKSMLKEQSFTDDDTKPLLDITALMQEIETHRPTSPDSSDEEIIAHTDRWKCWTSALSTMRAKFCFRKNTSRSEPLLRTTTAL